MSRKKLSSVIFQIVCIAIGIIILFPVIYAVSISFMKPDEILRRDIHVLPNSLYVGNYHKALTKTTLIRFLLNSFIVTFGASIVRLITASTAAFSFAFFKYKGKNLIFMLYLGTMMIPADILIVQNYATVSSMGLVNNYLGMMIVFFFTALNVFVLRQHFLSYSSSLREASFIDGCTNFKFFYKILLPSSVPVLTTTFISSFVGVWNQYLWPLLVTNRNEMRTAQVAVTLLNFPDESPHGAIMAAATLILIPSVVIFLVFQRQIKGGMMAGAVKG